MQQEMAGGSGEDDIVVNGWFCQGIRNPNREQVSDAVAETTCVQLAGKVVTQCERARDG